MKDDKSQTIDPNDELAPEIAPEELETGNSENGETEADDVTFDEESELGPAELIKKLRAKLKLAVEEKQSYLNNWQRDKAEFVNARKRDEGDKQEFLKFAKMGIIEDILPVLDSFDMAMTHGTNKNSEVSKEWKDGFEGIYNQLLGILAKHGVTPFGLAGDAFDPNLHHSIGTVKTEKASDDHKISDVAQKGYKMGDRVVRPALVRVWEI